MRRGRGDSDLPDSVFDVYGEGVSSLTGYGQLSGFNGFRAVQGRDDYNLPEPDFAPVTGTNGSPNAAQPESVVSHIREGFRPGRTPTPFWEYAFLGMDQSRTGYIDPETIAATAQWRISFRPYNDDTATEFWPPVFPQETYAPYTGPIDDVWGSGGG